MKLKLFALNATQEFGNAVAEHLGQPLSEHEEYDFDDGECYVAPKTGIKENVRGCDVFVIQSIYTDRRETVDKKLFKMLVFMGALKDASAARITAVIPYYPYARQDRKTTSRAPITTKYLARIISAMWADRILSLDVHNPTAIQNAYPIPCDLLEANILFSDYITKLVRDCRDLCILSPDSGGLGRARKFRKTISEKIGREVGIACLDKVHTEREIRGYDIMGEVRGKTIIIYDDMISSGKTVLECLQAAERAGCKSVLCACASHGLFVGDANEYLASDKLSRIIVTDTIQPFRLNQSLRDRKLTVMPTTMLFAEAIRRIHEDESISDLLDPCCTR